MNALDQALNIAVKAHSGQSDRAGEAYVLHPLTVGLMGTTDEERMAGFLHDVIEDSDFTAQDLLNAGIPEAVVKAVQLLTHDKSQPYFEYVQQIIDSRNPIALRVKYNDLTHNYARGKGYPELQAKHGKALSMVQKAMEELNRVTLYQHDNHVAVVAFAAGCFWGVHHYLQKHPGVLRTLVGYTGGLDAYPTYERVRSHQSHHLEAVLVEYDPTQVDFESLCKLFFEIHDPGQTDGQGPDLGEQYLSGVFYSTDEQLQTTQLLSQQLRTKGFEVHSRVEKLQDFWIAEGYHQDYYANTGGSPYCHFRIKKF